MRSGGGLGVLAADGLDDLAHADGLGADFDAHDLPINDRADLLNIRHELARGDAGDLGPDAAKVFGLAAMGDLVAEGRLLTGEITNAWHRNSYLVQKSSPAV